MIQYDKFELKNGLRVIFHKDNSSPMAVVNTLYDVGARDEDESQTGFAHLFEHLMFGGSVNIPDFDAPLQRAGGESNAFTSNDITNYYAVIPKQNMETALWLESDRMLQLAFTDKSLEVQRNVVIEEFKQRYLNQPYGDVWLHLRPLAYQVHPYKWATIGKELSHIENAKMENVLAFFEKHYHPANAILTIAGDFELDEVKKLVEKWYADIPAKPKHTRNLPKEPKQTEYRELTIERDVPADAFYYAFKMGDRKSDSYYTADLVSDIFGRGRSSILYQGLIASSQIATEIQCYILGSLDDGLILISGKLNDKSNFDELDTHIWEELHRIVENPISEDTLTKVRNKWETGKAFSDMGLLPRAMNLAMYELMGDIELINQESALYNAINIQDIHTFCKQTFIKSNCSLLQVKRSRK